MSLHRILSLVMVALAVLALGAAVSLTLLTTYLHRTTVQLETAFQSVRIAEEMQIDLLSYILARDPFSRSTLESSLRLKLRQAQQFVNEPTEQEMLKDAEQHIEAHFAQSRKSPDVAGDEELQEAFRSLKGFVDVNVEQADDSMRASERWDDFGDRLGVGFSVLLILGMTAVLLWLHRAAFKPVFDIQRAIREFAAGRKESRAPEYGPEEMRSIARQFNEMAESLDRQYERQLSFLASVAHDLRNPLGALKASASVLASDRKLPPETVSNLTSIIQRQVHGLDRMIGDLLDTSRIEAGRLELRVQECDVRSIVKDAFDLFRCSSKDHEFVLELSEQPITAQCDPLRIQQVLNNLISNAIKYSPNGGRVEVALEQSSNEALLRVADQGMGIEEDELPYIFEPFRRTTASREEVPGVGLGLSVAQRIVRAHGGRIQVESRKGNGTTFRVYLPVLRDAIQKRTA